MKINVLKLQTRSFRFWHHPYIVGAHLIICICIVRWFIAVHCERVYIFPVKFNILFFISVMYYLEIYIYIYIYMMINYGVPSRNLSFITFIRSEITVHLMQLGKQHLIDYLFILLNDLFPNSTILPLQQ